MIFNIDSTKKEIFLVPKRLSNQILLIGPDYVNFRGGIGYVVNVYSKNFETFHYISTHKTEISKTNLILFFIKQYFLLVKKLIALREIKVIHIHGASYGSFFRKFFIFFTTKYIFRKKVIYHAHGAEFEKFFFESNIVVKALIRFMVNNVNLLICLSNYWKSFFENNFKDINIVVLSNVINDSKHYPTACLLDRKQITFLFLGAIGERKGIFDLLEVFKENRSILRGHVRLLIGGNGEIDRLLQYILSNDLAELVEFKGWVSGDQKNQLLSDSDVFILPSYNEGQPISILEAVSYGLPVISTKVGGIPELIDIGKNGFLINPGNKSELFDCIHTFVKNPQIIHQMKAEAVRISKNFSPNNVIPKLTSIYEGLLK